MSRRKYSAADPTATLAVSNVMKSGQGRARPRRTMTVHIENRMAAYCSGWQCRELLTDLRRGRPPLWSPLRRAWCTTEATAMDLVALCERRGFDIVLTSDYQAEQSTPAEPVVEQPDPAHGLW